MIMVITVTGKDRPGIISSLTEALYRSRGNLEDASMTILEGEFAMIFLAELKNRSLNTKFRQELRKLEKKMNLVIFIKEIKHGVTRGEKHKSGTVPWVVSVLGKDKAGIVYRVSKLLADSNLNITDLNSKIIGRGSKTAYALILEVDLPRRNLQLISQLKRKFRAIEKNLGLTVAFNPLELSHF